MGMKEVAHVYRNTSNVIATVTAATNPMKEIVPTPVLSITSCVKRHLSPNTRPIRLYSSAAIVSTNLAAVTGSGSVMTGRTRTSVMASAPEVTTCSAVRTAYGAIICQRVYPTRCCAMVTTTVMINQMKAVVNRTIVTIHSIYAKLNPSGTGRIETRGVLIAPTAVMSLSIAATSQTRETVTTQTVTMAGSNAAIRTQHWVLFVSRRNISVIMNRTASVVLMRWAVMLPDVRQAPRSNVMVVISVLIYRDAVMALTIVMTPVMSCTVSHLSMTRHQPKRPM